MISPVSVTFWFRSRRKLSKIRTGIERLSSDEGASFSGVEGDGRVGAGLWSDGGEVSGFGKDILSNWFVFR